MVRTGSVSTKRLPRHLRNEDIPTHTFTPGTYQVELLDAALKRNTIVCLGSNSGNKFISVMLIREMSHQLRPELHNGGKRSVVLLKNGDNISSRAQSMQHYTDLIVSQLASLEGTESWSCSQWNQFICKNHIIVTVPHIFNEIFQRDILTASQINLIVMEDCHLILQNHPYVEIMKKIQSSSLAAEFLPRILGLTTSFMSQKCGDPRDLENSIRTLENLLSAKAETATLVIAERYGIRPEEIVVECDDYDDVTGTLSVLDEILCSALDFLNDCNLVEEDDDERDPKEIPIFVFSECLNILYVLGPWCASCIANMFVNQIEKILKHESVSIHKKFLHYCSTQLRLITATFDKLFTPNYDVEELLQYSSPKVCELVKHLRKFQPDYDFMIVSSPGDLDRYMVGDELDMYDDSMDLSDDDNDDLEKSRKNNIIHIAVKKETEEQESLKPLDPLGNESDKYLCGIVFVDHRYVTLALNKFLEEVCSWDKCLYFVKSHHITGQGLKNIGGKKGGGKNYKKQEEVLRMFRRQEVNLLISTSVLEEGIDVPKCNLIMKFDPPKDYSSYSRSKGRARARNSEYVIMVENRKLETFKKDLSMFKGIEEVLVGRWQEENQRDDLVDDDDFAYNYLQPYIPNSDDPTTCVTADTAIALVNRYCAKLPSDAFTHLTPKCSVDRIQCNESDEAMYKASLRLPINSPFKSVVEGIPMPSVLLAKKAVALKLCETLHKAGELDDQLMPVGKEIFCVEEEDESEWEGEEYGGEARPGTTKRKQYYFKRLAASLVGTQPKEDSSYLYNLNMHLTRPISDEQNTKGRKIYAPQESSRGFGLLTSKEIPLIPSFPVYTRSGEVTVSVSMVYEDIAVSTEQLIRLRKFHQFVFTNVLRLEKDPMEFLPDNSDLGYLVVPLNTDFETRMVKIDWDFITEVEESAFHVKRNIYNSKRDIFVFSQEEYEDAVVMPSYRNIDQPQHFYVAEIRFDLNPSSPFPSPELYKTFSEYYTTKYGLTITNFEQPLLDVDHTSARLNLLTPRYMNQKGVALPTSSAETKKARRENLQQKQILVPELCEIHVFPASLWRKAVCLPTILYRMNYLLVSEEIRIKIAEATKIGLLDLPENFCFPPLDFGFASKEEGEVEVKTEDGDLSDDEQKIKETGDSFSDLSVPKETNSKDESMKDLHSCDVALSSLSVFDTSSDAEDASTGEVAQLNSGASIHSQGKEISIKSDTKESSSIDGKCSDTNVCDKNVVQNSFVQTFQNLSQNPSASTDATEVNKSKVCDDGQTKNGYLLDHNEQSKQLSKSEVNFSTCNGRMCCDVPSENKEHHCHCDRFQGESVNTQVSKLESQIESLTVNDSAEKCVVSVSLKDNEICTLYDQSEQTITACSQTKHLNTTPAITHDKFLEVSNDPFETDMQQETKSLCDSCKKVVDTKCTIDLHTQQENLTYSGNRLQGDTTHLETIEDNKISNQDNVLHDSMESHCCTEPETNSLEETSSENEDCNLPSENSAQEQNTAEDIFSNVGRFTDTSSKLFDDESEKDEAKELPDPELFLDEDIDLATFIGPSPCTILQALTMSNANDFFNLERLETIGDSFLKYAITVYLYCTYPGIHEGKLSYLRSKQVSNCNLYRLGKKKGLAECMISTKFEPYENWLPPGYVINDSKRKGPVPKVMLVRNNLGQLEKIQDPDKINSYFADDPSLNWTPSIQEIQDTSVPVKMQSVLTEAEFPKNSTVSVNGDQDDPSQSDFNKELEDMDALQDIVQQEEKNEMALCLIPYNLQTLHSIPDKSIADGVESLIGCYLTACGKKAALKFMHWLGLKVLPKRRSRENSIDDNTDADTEFDALQCPESPVINKMPNTDSVLEHLLIGYNSLEEKINYKFKDRSYLLQAFTHASYHHNTVTDCYQRLEFLGDAILDYVITRHLYEDSCKYSPGVLTDLRSALVNNNIFAALAVKWDFHKYFRAISPPLFRIIEKFVTRQKEREDEIDLSDEEDGGEDEEERVQLEVPKALGDIFESLAGAIYLDSGMSLDVVWKVYYRIMKPQIDKYLKSIPKSPVRELLEMEPETAKFEKPERTLEGKIRVTVNVVSKGVFTGVGRNYRIAKSAAAKKALGCIRVMQAQGLLA